jgi:nucleotide-binding universal stress UspA family protein
MRPIATLLCLLDESPSSLVALTYACVLAKRQNALLRILNITSAVAPEPELMVAGGIGGLADGQVDPGKLRQVAKSICQTHGLDLWNHYNCPVSFNDPCACFHSVSGLADDVVPAEGRTADLLLCGAATAHALTEHNSFFSVLLQTGRPVLVVPETYDCLRAESVFDRAVSFAWDGSLEASRAVHTVLPFLSADCEVHLLSVIERNRSLDKATEAGVIDMMRRRGRIPKVSHWPQGDMKVSELLQERAKALGSDLLIAGAYGRNPLVERIFGGTTFELIRSSRMPVLFMH